MFFFGITVQHPTLLHMFLQQNFCLVVPSHVRVKLPQVEPEPTNDVVRATDRQSKTKMKHYAEKKHSFKQSPIRVGDDSVLVRQNKINKLFPPYDPKPFKFISDKGSLITARA
ncbi:hypothetical protein HOLleu_40088 [Holothuria leucospilota]|uniref:Uncharacterized protein n=1 Tax=Holothuria leucospilota TaxID=206669 RepID=A0A9Q0YHU2_HOLLE|nr:hypothetical protein HOLleu_40088 [Holothuria leucospilota]